MSPQQISKKLKFHQPQGERLKLRIKNNSIRIAQAEDLGDAPIAMTEDLMKDKQDPKPKIKPFGHN